MVSLADKKASPKELLKRLDIMTQKIMHEVELLPNNESLFINVGRLGHATQLVIKKEGTQLAMSLVDSSGGLSRARLIKAPLGTFKLDLLEAKHGSISLGLKLELPAAQFYAQGKEGIYQFLKNSSTLGHQEQEEVLARTLETIKKSSNPLMSPYRAFSAKWESTLAAFTSIAPHSVNELEILKSRQLYDNCYAERVLVNEVHELGKELHKKVHREFLKTSMEDLLNVIKEEEVLSSEEIDHLGTMESRMLSLEELQDLKRRLLEIKKTPKTFEEWKDIFTLFHHDLEALKVMRTEKTDIKKYTFQQLKDKNLSQDALKAAFVINKYNIFRQKRRKIGLEIEGKMVQMDITTYLKLLELKPDALTTQEVSRMLKFLKIYAVMHRDTAEKLYRL